MYALIGILVIGSALAFGVFKFFSDYRVVKVSDLEKSEKSSTTEKKDD